MYKISYNSVKSLTNDQLKNYVCKNTLIYYPIWMKNGYRIITLIDYISLHPDQFDLFIHTISFKYSDDKFKYVRNFVNNVKSNQLLSDTLNHVFKDLNLSKHDLSLFCGH